MKCVDSLKETSVEMEWEFLGIRYLIIYFI